MLEGDVLEGDVLEGDVLCPLPHEVPDFCVPIMKIYT